MIELHKANKRFIMLRRHKMVKIATAGIEIRTVNIFAVHVGVSYHQLGRAK